jgi:hypothetical protein
MFRPLASLALALLISVAAPSQNVIDARTAAVVAYWKVGDTKSYKLTRTKTGDKAASTTVSLDLRVLSSTDTSYTVECVYRDMKVLSGLPPDPKAAQATKKILGAVDGLRVVVSTSETGVLNDVTNVAEIQKHCDKIIQELVALGADAEERKQMRAAFKEILTAEALAVTATEDVGHLLLPFGIEFTLDKAESGEVEFENPFGGDPLAGTLSIKMTKLDVGRKQASIHTEQQMDPKGLQATLDELAKDAGNELTKEEREEIAQAIRSMKISDNSDHEVDLNGAWVTKARNVRLVKVLDQEQKDERVYVLQ